MTVALPPYALALPTFRFRALAALAGRAPLGGPREAALACLLAARLAAPLVAGAPVTFDDAARAARAAGARTWLASMAVPAAARVPAARLFDATGRPSAAEVAIAPAPRRPARRSGAVRAVTAAPPVGEPIAVIRGRVAEAMRALAGAADAWLDAPARQELLALAASLEREDVPA